MKQSRLFVRGVSILSMVAFTLGASVSAAWAATYTVSITPTQFIPSTLKVSAGDSINFLNTTSATQSARTSVASGFNTGNIGPGQSKLVTVSNAGTYTYASAFNSSLTGTVEVTGSSTGLTATSSATTSSSSATTTTTLTSQPAKTQQQPVSGVEDVLIAVLALGGSALAAGWYARQRVQQRVYSDLVELPLVQVSEPPSSHE